MATFMDWATGTPNTFVEVSDSAREGVEVEGLCECVGVAGWLCLVDRRPRRENALPNLDELLFPLKPLVLVESLSRFPVGMYGLCGGENIKLELEGVGGRVMPDDDIGGSAGTGGGMGISARGFSNTEYRERE